jgi:hypothetical protein
VPSLTVRPDGVPLRLLSCKGAWSHPTLALCVGTQLAGSFAGQPSIGIWGITNAGAGQQQEAGSERDAALVQVPATYETQQAVISRIYKMHSAVLRRWLGIMQDGCNPGVRYSCAACRPRPSTWMQQSMCTPCFTTLAGLQRCKAAPASANHTHSHETASAHMQLQPPPAGTKHIHRTHQPQNQRDYRCELGHAPGWLMHGQRFLAGSSGARRSNSFLARAVSPVL